MLKINVKNEFHKTGIIPRVHGIAWSMSIEYGNGNRIKCFVVDEKEKKTIFNPFWRLVNMYMALR